MLQRYSFYFNYQTNFKFLKRKRDKKSAHATINGMRAINSYLIQVSQVNSSRPERAEAPSPGHRPGYNSNQQGAL